MPNSDPMEKSSANVDTGKPAVPTVDWDDSEMKSSYANVVNASSTREEVNLFFGTNQTWKADEKRQFHVRLSDRIVLSPFAAKRLWILLGAVLKEYEARFGNLGLNEISGLAGGTTGAATQAKAAGQGKPQ
jgi:hypothetical protein